MTTQQPEALHLSLLLAEVAPYLEGGERGQWIMSAANELRRLHEANTELLAALKWMVENDDTNEGDEPVERLGGASWNECNEYWIDGLNKARAAINKAERTTT